MPAQHIAPINRILVTTGLTLESLGAVHLARSLAQTLGAELHAVHVIVPASKAETRAMPDLAARIEQQAREELERYALTHDLRGFATLHIALGQPGAEIIRLATTLKADLVVIGRYGKGGPKRGTIGSVADRVVRRCPVSVLVVQPEFQGPIARIGVASTCEDDSAIELERAMDLAARLDLDRIDLIKAYDIPAGYHLVSSYEDATTRLAEVHTELAIAQITAARELLKSTVAVAVESRLGPPVDTLAQFAHDAALDLLIIRTHNRTGPAELFLDRISERVINNAACNIWAEKSPAESQSLLDVFRHLLD